MRIYFLAIGLILAGCAESVEDQHSTAQRQLTQDELYLENTKAICANGPERSIDEVREEALAEWDAAVGENLDNISPEQEWEIRKSLGAQMGLAPSEVNGWKDIYRNRAEQAKRVLDGRSGSRSAKEAVRQSEQKAACDKVQDALNDVDLGKIELARLDKELATSGNEPGFFTYLGYLLAAIAAFIIGIMWYDKRRVNQIKVDGLLTQAQLFKNKLSTERWQEIVQLHAARDFDALKVLVRESAPPHLKDNIIQ